MFAPGTPLRLDFGCGVRKKEGYHGIDIKPFPGVDTVLDAGTQPWPWGDNTVDEVYASHFIEHLTAQQRIHFVNEAYRVLKPNGQLNMVAPSWSSMRAYGDLTHQWPPVTQFWPLYLNREWRIVQQQAPHNDFYTCDFVGQSVFGMHPSLVGRSIEYQTDALTFLLEAAQDIIINLSARKG